MANATTRSLATTAVLLIAASLTGCATAPVAVRTGDEVAVSFTCRQDDGAIAVSTSPGAAKEPGTRLSPLFMAREATDPVVISAGAAEPLSPSKVRPLEEDVLQQLRAKVLGMKKGETANVTLRAMRLPESRPGEGVVRYNRVLTYPKEQTMSPAAFKERFGKEAVAGQAVGSGSPDEVFKSEVVSVSESEVLIRNTAAPGAAVPLFFGTGTVTDAGSEYRIRIDSEEGRLVRNQFISGRVLQVTDGIIAIDFGDQYGGQTLNCAVTVDAVTPGAAPAAGAEATAGGAGATAGRGDRTAAGGGDVSETTAPNASVPEAAAGGEAETGAPASCCGGEGVGK